MKSYDNSTYKMPIRAQNSNKGTFGKVLNFAGSKNYIGAAYLSTVSILKCGGDIVFRAGKIQNFTKSPFIRILCSDWHFIS